MTTCVLALVLAGLAACAVAAPEPITAAAPITVDTPPPPLAGAAIFLNRCSGGCTVHRGDDDAEGATSSIPRGLGPDLTISEYQDVAGATGSAADTEWHAVVACVAAAYAPFDVSITDQRPVGPIGVEAIVAGDPGEIGLPSDVLGVAPLAADCSATEDVVVFAFADAHGTADRVSSVCATAAQQVAHAFGLDHEYAFLNGTSACSDLMSLRSDCAPRSRTFVDESANCGEIAPRVCKCGATQNSYRKLAEVVGLRDAP
jgi:hypothetical protein